MPLVAEILTWQGAHSGEPVTLLELTRNFVQEAAMLACLDFADGRCGVVILIDSDLQHSPERISAIVTAWRLATVGSWDLEGPHLPQPQLGDHLYQICRDLFDLFNGSEASDTAA